MKKLVLRGRQPAIDRLLSQHSATAVPPPIATVR
jgi:hypothetical protein